jgi:hypothetical protein
VRSRLGYEPNAPVRSETDIRSISFWLMGMEQLFHGLFWVLDLRAILAIVLLGLKLLQETETRRSGRVSGSAVLGHAETLLAAMRHILAVRWKEGEKRRLHFLLQNRLTGFCTIDQPTGEDDRPSMRAILSGAKNVATGTD